MRNLSAEEKAFIWLDAFPAIPVSRWTDCSEEISS